MGKIRKLSAARRHKLQKEEYSKDHPYEGKTSLGKVWYFIWNDNSIWSWLANIVIAYILIKFIVYPGLGLVFGTNIPIVAVVSGSMEHSTADKCLEMAGNNCIKYADDVYSICGKDVTVKGSYNIDEYWDTCGDWYRENSITKYNFDSFSFKSGFNKGDLMVLKGEKPQDLKTGDVIIFLTPMQSDPIIHRVVKVWKTDDGIYHFQTKGDHNSGSSKAISETDITPDRILGKAFVRVPLLGWVKIGFVEILKLIGLAR